MNAGRVEQVGGPREIYEKPATSFVADFIGSLNALDVTIGEVVGGYAVARVGRTGRVVVPVDGAVAAGSALRVAVRPEWVRIEAVGTTATDGGSRLEGSVAQVVYLGMYTQFHVDTPVGRVVSHRLAEGAPRSLDAGSPVAVAWDADRTYTLAV
jgi:spermidine/putrescine transport system ATP-binding protein